MDFKGVVLENLDWINVAQDREKQRVLLNTVMNIRVAWNARDVLTGAGITSFSQRIMLHEVSWLVSSVFIYLFIYCRV